jgi:hypothetical protein
MKYYLSISIILLFSFAIAAVIGLFKQDAEGQKKAPPEQFTKVPQIKSKIAALQLVSAKIENGPVVLVLKNNSAKPIIAVDVECGDEKDGEGDTFSGIYDPDLPPTEIAKPYGTLSVSFSVSRLRRGFPLRISGVIYADGSSDGEEKTLKSMQRGIEHLRALKRGEIQ